MPGKTVHGCMGLKAGRGEALDMIAGGWGAVWAAKRSRENFPRRKIRRRGFDRADREFAALAVRGLSGKGAGLDGCGGCGARHVGFWKMEGQVEWGCWVKAARACLKKSPGIKNPTQEDCIGFYGLFNFREKHERTLIFHNTIRHVSLSMGSASETHPFVEEVDSRIQAGHPNYFMGLTFSVSDSGENSYFHGTHSSPKISKKARFSVANPRLCSSSSIYRKAVTCRRSGAFIAPDWEHMLSASTTNSSEETVARFNHPKPLAGPRYTSFLSQFCLGYPKRTSRSTKVQPASSPTTTAYAAAFLRVPSDLALLLEPFSLPQKAHAL